MKAVIYARFSPRPNEAESLSIETQVNRAREYCKNNGYEIIGEFSDQGLSGKSTSQREGLRQAMEAVCTLDEQGALVIYSLSRLARSVKDAIALTEDLDDAGANLVSLTEKIDTSTAMGRAFFQILAVLAQLERELVVERTQDAMLRHQANGRRMSFLPPFGWILDPKDSARLVEDAGEQAIIQRVVAMDAAGQSARQIARTLNAEGVDCRQNGWYHSMIGRILKRHRRGRTS